MIRIIIGINSKNYIESFSLINSIIIIIINGCFSDFHFFFSVFYFVVFPFPECGRLQSKRPQHKRAVSVIGMMALIYRRYSRTHSYRLMNSPLNVIIRMHVRHTLPMADAMHSSSILIGDNV